MVTEAQLKPEIDILTLQPRLLFRLDNSQWNAFLAILDTPSEPMPRLEKLLKQPGILD